MDIDQFVNFENIANGQDPDTIRKKNNALDALVYITEKDGEEKIKVILTTPMDGMTKEKQKIFNIFAATKNKEKSKAHAADKQSSFLSRFFTSGGGKKKTNKKKTIKKRKTNKKRKTKYRR